MRARGLVMAFGFIVIIALLAWLTGDRGPFAEGPAPIEATSK